MNAMIRILLSLACALPLCGQQQASTLLRLADTADAVAVATMTAATDPSPEWRRVTFHVDESLKGALGASFSALEPAGRCCGNALYSVEPGETYVVFLQMRGGAAHPIAGERGLVKATAEIVAHVKRLIQSRGDEAAQVRALAQCLSHDDPRIAQDAALALGSHPHAVTDEPSRELLRTALRHHAHTASTALPSLALAVARADGDQAASQLFSLYLEAPTEDGAKALRRALESLPTTSVAAAARSCPTQDEAQIVRAANLLEQRADPAQLDVLQRMLRQAERANSKAAVACALLANGIEPSQLAGQVDEAVLEASKQLRANKLKALPRAATPAR